MPPPMRPPRPRLPALVALPLLAACAAAPPPPPQPVAPPPTPEPPLDACTALQKPLGTLRRLAALVALGRSMPGRPLRPESFAAELEADAARARSAHSDDADLAKLAADTAARLDRIDKGVHMLTGASGAQAEAARIALLEEMERGELLVALGDTRCTKGESMAGHLPASALQRVVRSAYEGFRSCHEAALRRVPGLRGTVRVRFVVAGDGSVREAANADQGPPDPLEWGAPSSAPPLRDAEASACVVATFRKLTFPKPQGGTFSATLPIELGPVAGGP
jgi:hypothetical protein